MSRHACILGGFILLVACTAEQEEAPQSTPDPVVVYASYEDRNYLPMLFAAYTKRTGVAVIVRHGNAEAMVGDVIRNEITPPADVLITPPVRGVYRAAEEGALRPIQSRLLEQRVASALRDPDALWTALSFRAASIAYDPVIADASELDDPTALADPKFRGRLCLSSSAEPANRTVIAGLIDRLGVRETELAVRGWLTNLARPVFESESKLWMALETGDCGVALLSNMGAAWLENSRFTELWSHELMQPYVDIEGIGVARHARNPDGALELIDWLLSDDIQARHSAAVLANPATGDFEGVRNVGVLAWHDEEVAKLAERAGYR